MCVCHRFHNNMRYVFPFHTTQKITSNALVLVFLLYFFISLSLVPFQRKFSNVIFVVFTPNWNCVAFYKCGKWIYIFKKKKKNFSTGFSAKSYHHRKQNQTLTHTPAMNHIIPGQMYNSNSSMRSSNNIIILFYCFAWFGICYVYFFWQRVIVLWTFFFFIFFILFIIVFLLRSFKIFPLHLTAAMPQQECE